VLALVLATAIAWPLGIKQDFPAPATPRAAAISFVDAFVRDDLGVLRSLFASMATPPSDAVDLIERYDCITIRSYDLHVGEIADGVATATLRLDVTGRTIGGPRHERALPALWDLSLIRENGAWRIASAVPREQIIAAEFLRAPSEAERRCILERASNADSALILWHVAFDGADLPRNPDVLAAITLARTMAREHNDLALESHIVRMLAYIAYNNHDVAGIAYATEGERIAKESGDADAIAMSYFTAGIARWFSGNLAAAVAKLDETRALADRCADPRGAIKSIYMAGLILGQMGNTRGAIEHQSRVLALAEKYGWEEGVSASTIGLCNQWLTLGQPDVARPFALRAYRTALRIGQHDHAKHALWAYAVQLWETGGEHEAAQLIRFILDHEPPSSARQEMQAGFATYLIAANRLDEAEALLELATSQPGAPRFDLLLARTSLALAEHRYEDALTSVNAAFAVANDPSTSTADITTAKVNQGRTLLALGRTDEAFRAFLDAIGWIEEMREETPSDSILRARFFVDRMQPYEAIVALSIARGDASQALFYAEKKRGRALGDVMRRGLVDESAPLTAGEKEKEAELTQRLSTANRALLATHDARERASRESDRDAARLALIAYRGELDAVHPRLRSRRGQGDAEVLTRPRQLLPDERGAIVLYDVQSEQTFVFVITRASDELRISTTRIARSRDVLETAAQRLAQAIRKRDLAWARESRVVYDLLIAPIAAQLAGRSSIAILPDGPLWDVPFHALRQPSGEVLLEAHTISYAPSLATLANDSGRPRQHRSLLALGDPAVAAVAFEALGGTAQHARLPDAAAEVEAIANTYTPDATETLVGVHATEAVFKQKAKDFSVLHFATHGVLDHSPLHSALLLAASGDDDGLLEAREIVDLPLTADLTVLSACDSGRGDFTPGEGVMGLSWAFMVAGCRTTIASHWQVGSATTRRLMTTFHRELRQHRSPAAALRQAQLSIMREPPYRHPIYWAAFVSIGAQ
jgi:CHAT domain-containing protein